MEIQKIPDFNKLIGRTVKALREFWGVPKGSIGKIVQIYEPFDRHYKGTGIKSCMVEWQGEEFKLPIGRQMTDGFAPDELRDLELIK